LDRQVSLQRAVHGYNVQQEFFLASSFFLKDFTLEDDDIKLHPNVGVRLTSNGVS